MLVKHFKYFVLLNFIFVNGMISVCTLWYLLYVPYPISSMCLQIKLSVEYISVQFDILYYIISAF